ncbi:MAG: conserved exported protein of unknown function [Promethearchaeota archaeon]|nr:MAG: conserved exported protein of unknown function [Candidatus Lokiarchaeota archaeon]
MKQIAILIYLLAITSLQSCSAQVDKKNQAEELKLDSLINTLITKKGIPSIAIGIVKDDEVILAKGFGYANVEDKILANENTIYQLGSVTKMFTGHLLARLINNQKISISDTLANFFPDTMSFPKSPAGQVVTIKEIATHTSEFPRYPQNIQRIDPEPFKGYSVEEMLKGIEMVTIDTIISTRYNYSNFGYGVLGTAMENRMERSLNMLMNENIFDPYNMSNTSLLYKEDFNITLATPYLEVSPYKRTEPWDMGTLSGAGNIYSNITDLNKFMIELLQDTPINRIQQTKQFKINDTWNYGLGCFIVESKKRNTQIIYHGGDIDGYASSLSLYPEYNLGFVILTNWGEGQVIGDAFNQITNEIVKHYLGEITE